MWGRDGPLIYNSIFTIKGLKVTHIITKISRINVTSNEMTNEINIGKTNKYDE